MGYCENLPWLPTAHERRPCPAGSSWVCLHTTSPLSHPYPSLCPLSLLILPCSLCPESLTTGLKWGLSPGFACAGPRGPISAFVSVKVSPSPGTPLVSPDLLPTSSHPPGLEPLEDPSLGPATPPACPDHCLSPQAGGAFGVRCLRSRGSPVPAHLRSPASYFCTFQGGEAAEDKASRLRDSNADNMRCSGSDRYGPTGKIKKRAVDKHRLLPGTTSVGEPPHQ